MRLGLWMIVFAVLWKVVGSGVLQTVAEKLKGPSVAAFLLYLETGRVVPPETAATEPQQTLAAVATETTVPQTTVETTVPQTTAEQRLPVAFTKEEGVLVDMSNATRYAVDLEQLVTRPVNWDLTQGGPKVLIVHTHATESFTKAGESYEESGNFRTLNEGYNMVRVGEVLAQVLGSYGIEVIHDRTLHDYPSYNGSYNASRKTVERYLQQFPDLALVLDVHRDAVELADGRQMDTSAQVNGRESARLMLVMGTDAGGLHHPRWQENLTVAAQLHAQLERSAPGIMRQLYLRRERFNQDLLPGMLLVEVGAAGNTLPEALTAAEALGHAIGALRYGTN